MTLKEFLSKNRWLLWIGFLLLGLRFVIAIYVGIREEHQDRYRYMTVDRKRYVDLRHEPNIRPGAVFDAKCGISCLAALGVPAHPARVFDTLRGVECYMEPPYDDGAERLSAAIERTDKAQKEITPSEMRGAQILMDGAAKHNLQPLLPAHVGMWKSAQAEEDKALERSSFLNAHPEERPLMGYPFGYSYCKDIR